ATGCAACDGGSPLNGSALTPDKFEACVTAFNAGSCADFRNGVLPAECKIAGSLANGTACGSDSQCSSAYCKKPLNTTCGVCAARVPGGQNCTVDKDCQDGLVCGGGQCKAPGVAGGTCSNNQPCLATLYCNNNTCAAPAVD